MRHRIAHLQPANQGGHCLPQTDVSNIRAPATEHQRVSKCDVHKQLDAMGREAPVACCMSALLLHQAACYACIQGSLKGRHKQPASTMHGSAALLTGQHVLLSLGMIIHAHTEDTVASCLLPYVPGQLMSCCMPPGYAFYILCH